MKIRFRGLSKAGKIGEWLVMAGKKTNRKE